MRLRETPRPFRALRSGASGVVLSLVTVAVLLSGQAADAGPVVAHGAVSSTGAAPAPAFAPRPHTVVAFGDSVPAGFACHCSPFPKVYGTRLAQRTGRGVAVRNLAVSGLTTAGLVRQLRTHAARTAVRAADVVQVEIGANDFGDHLQQVVDGRCERRGHDCVADELAELRTRLTTVLSRIRALRDGAPTTVLVLGYWNVFKDGAVGRRLYGPQGLRNTRRLTRRVNAVISDVASTEKSTYVDLVKPFVRSGRNVTSLLTSDGDHPDAVGHELIARTLLDAGLPRAR